MSSQPAFLSMHDYSLPAKVYWVTTFLLGAVVLGISVADVVQLSRVAILQVLAGIAVATVTGFFPVRIPGSKTSVAGAEIFVFLLLLLHGPGAAAIAAAGEAAIGSWRTSGRWTSRLGSPAMAALAMYGCGSALSVMVPGLRHLLGGGNGLLFVLLLFAAFAYFATSTLLMASLISLKRGESVQPLRILREHVWLGLAYAASASISGLVYVTFDAFGTTVLLAAVPIIAMFLSTLHFYFRQAETAEKVQQERLAAAEREAAEAARHVGELQASESRFHSAFTHAAVGMMLVSEDSRILQTNAALCALLGRAEADVAGSDLATIVHADDIDVLRAEVDAMLNGSASQFALELRCLHGDRTDVWVTLNGSFFNAESSGERCLIVQMQDVTARKHAESRLQHIAFHDGLTHLPNRRHFLEQLDRVVAGAKRNASARFAVMFLDFDRFKMVNDSLGHGAGDELLVVVARRLQGCLRPTDLVARLGGDEFAILIENFRSDNEIVELAERVQRVIREPIRLCGSDVTTSASIGITTSAFRYDAPEQVMRDADIAMYKAKELGKARYALFDSALHAEISSQLWMEGELRRAVDHGQIGVDFQPIFDLRTRRLHGFEALARWTHPERGAILPGRFIPMAEETGLIVPLGRQVLQLACSNFARWQRSIPNARTLRLHVNVSGVQLSQPGCAARMRKIVNSCGIAPDQLTLELTESVLIERLSAARPNMLQLRDMGARISIDDFGIGYSSLSALQDLPISEIKIDRTFVRRMGDGDGEEVVKAIIALGRSMGKRVIAEGIETAAQCDRLVGMGCERGQGYLLGRPMAPDYAENLTREAAPVVRIAYTRPTLVS